MANGLNSVEQMMLEKINKAIKIIDSYNIKYIEYGVLEVPQGEIIGGLL